MTSLTTPPACDPEDWLCDRVIDVTGNEWLGAAADWLIAKPTLIVFIFAIALLLRWLLFKAIARLVDSASQGVLPSRLGNDAEEGDAAARIAAARRKQRAETMGGVLG